MSERDQRNEQVVNALQSAVLLAGELRVTLHDLHAALQRAVAALREKGGK
jgi:hypothetical protein